jgi:hypothetical protein
MLHVKDLNVLNVRKENQRMAAKLPDWAITRWSRTVAEALYADSYPTFKQFVSFVGREARVVCHPFASIHAVKSMGSSS